MTTPKARADGITDSLPTEFGSLLQSVDRYWNRMRSAMCNSESEDARLEICSAISSVTGRLASLLAQLAERDAVIGRLRKVAVKAEKLSSNPVTGPLLSADDRAAMMHDDLAMALAALSPTDLEAP